MECRRGILSLLGNKNKEREKLFLINGSRFLEKLIASPCNGRCNFSIRNFSAKELIKATNNFDELLLHACGAKSYRGSFEGRPILVKYFYSGDTFDFGSFYYECINDIVVTFQMSHHNNVLKLLGYCLEFKYPALVYEYAGNELLSGFLYRDNESRSLSWKSRLRISKDIANTVVYLHTAFSTPIIYNNLAPSSVIVDQSGVVKLFDFSLSMPLPPGESQVTVDCVRGKNGFLVPEYFRDGIVSEKCDVYSFGVLLLQLVAGQNCWSDILTDNTIRHLDSDYVKTHELNEVVDPRILREGGGTEQDQQLQDFVALALRCTQNERDDRPEMIDVAKELRRIERSVRPN
uniref:Protein kinase domain-containing protein n=2 Tax=Davidia involucrata TaxID=16924 RepID=A0A5B7B5N7_DAVIN